MKDIIMGIIENDSSMNLDKDLKVQVRRGKGTKVKVPFLKEC